MDQEQTVKEFNRIILDRGEDLLKFLFFIAQSAYESTKKTYGYAKGKIHSGDIKNIKTFHKQVQGNSMYQTFTNSEVNLDKLKQHLKKSGVDFSFQNNDDGTTNVWIAAKDQAVLQDACQKTIKEITKDPKQMTEKLAKTEKDLKPREQIARLKKETAKVSKEKAKTKSSSKGKGKSI